MSLHDLVTKATDLTDHERDVVTQALRRGGYSFVSPDKESKLFTLFAFGRTTESIARVSKLPHPVIILTKLQYNWTIKRGLLAIDSPEESMREALREMGDTMLATLQMRVEQAFQDAMDGKMDTTGLIPTDVGELKKLVELVDSIRKLGVMPAKGSAPGVNVTVNAGTQVAALSGSQVAVASDPKLLESPEGRIKELKQLRGE